MTARTLKASWDKKGSKMRNKPVWECPRCSHCHVAKLKNVWRCLQCGGKAICHQSQKEYRRWCELKALEKAGQIRGLERQKKFNFLIGGIVHGSFIKTPKGRDLTYTADFVYEEHGPIGMGTFTLWQPVVEDAKGRKAGAAYDLYWLKRELMRLCHGIEIKEV